MAKEGWPEQDDENCKRPKKTANNRKHNLTLPNLSIANNQKQKPTLPNLSTANNRKQPQTTNDTSIREKPQTTAN